MMEHTPLFGDKGPPCNLEAEQAFLGALLANNRVFGMVEEFLLPEHFSDPVHGVIYRECLKLRALNMTVDAVTLKSRLEHSGALAEVGGTPYLAQLLSAMVGIINARDYALVVFDCWRRRQLLDIGWRLVNGAHNTQTYEDPAELANLAAAQAEAVAVGTTSLTANCKSGRDAMVSAIRQIEETQQSGKLPGVATGYDCMDRRTGGLKPGLLYIGAGRPGMGKTGLAGGIARNATRLVDNPNGAPVRTLYCAMEMTAEEMALRDLSALTRIPTDRLQLGDITPFEQAGMLQALADYGDPPLIYDDSMALTPRQIDIRVRMVKKEGPVGLVIVDHLHLMHPNEEHQRLEGTQRLTTIVNGLLKLARDHHVPVLALAQLSRTTEGREDKRPTLTDLRQCGTIEESAHAVFFIYREGYYQRQNEAERPCPASSLRVEAVFADEENRPVGPDDPVQAEIIWGKNRSGAPGTDLLYFHGPTTSFQELWSR